MATPKTPAAEESNELALARRHGQISRQSKGDNKIPLFPTPLILKVLEEIISEGNHFITACKVAGISWETFQGWRDRGGRGEPGLSEFVTMLDRAEAACERKALSIVMECAQQGKIKSIKNFWIKKRDGDGQVVHAPAVEEREDDNPDRWKAAAWMLENRFAERYSRMRRLQHSGYLTNRQVIVLEGEDDESLELTVWPSDGQEGEKPLALPESSQDAEAGPDGDEREG